jgi:hypothetical protein
MKRDIDLVRQLLLDIEARGADCSMSVLRTGSDNDADERVRYHLRLLVDAGYLQEVDRTSAGVPCLRLTDAGHELIELARSEACWREAKGACQERTGGLALAVVRGILLEWALAPRGRFVRPRYRPFADAVLAEPRYALPPAFEFDPYDGPWTGADGDHVRYIRVRPRHRNGWRRRSTNLDRGAASEVRLGASLPEHLI